jgi:hypothetical protein
VSNIVQIKSEKVANSSPAGLSAERIMALQKNTKPEQYRRYARHCLELVRVATSQNARMIQREMAAEWLKLADLTWRPSRQNQMK